jgi:hypothetical protein
MKSMDKNNEALKVEVRAYRKQYGMDAAPSISTKGLGVNVGR